MSVPIPGIQNTGVLAQLLSTLSAPLSMLQMWNTLKTNTMGQRQQAWINVQNPLHNSKRTSKHTAIYGTEATTMLAFHNHWKYGYWSVNNLLNLMESLQKLDINRPGATVVALSDAIKVRLEPDKGSRASGWININSDSTEDTMRHDYSLGDNNDGVIIVDSLTRKYCYVSVCEQLSDPDDTSIYSWPPFTPYSAEQYVRTYCPVLENDLETEMKILLMLDKLKQFDVLSQEELANLFPRMSQHIHQQTVNNPYNQPLLQTV